MKIFIALLVLMLPAVTRAQSAATPRTPGPPYPEKARVANITGSGKCRVVFDTAGRVAKATMIQSTGSDILDKNTLDWARAHWHGQKDAQTDVPITYQLAPAAPHVPAPPYPLSSMSNYDWGEGKCEVVFGDTGRVASAVMQKSTESDLFDRDTLDFARKRWTGPAHTRVLVPVVFRWGTPGPSAGSGIVFTPKPPYPSAARSSRESGSGMCRVTFDETGETAKAEMSKSIGSDVLDRNTVDFARHGWMGRPNSTVQVPITYRL